MNKHTPGPWQVAGYGVVRATLMTGSNVLVCSVRTGQPAHSRHSNLTANTRLIAAAPEMLEALKLINDAGIWANPKLAKIHNAIKSAIAKAEGK